MILLMQTIHTIFRVLIISLFIRAIMSWFIRDYSHPIPNFIYNFTELILMPMRKIFEKFDLNRSMIDFSFIATFFALQILDTIIMRLFINYILFRY